MFPVIRRGKRLKTADHIEGNVPYVSSSAANNAVDAFIGNERYIRKYKNCITLANSGSVGTAFYHCYEFIASDHVTALQSSRLNEYSYLFIATMISRLQKNIVLIGKLMIQESTKRRFYCPLTQRANLIGNTWNNTLKCSWQSWNCNTCNQSKHNKNGGISAIFAV